MNVKSPLKWLLPISLLTAFFVRRLITICLITVSQFRHDHRVMFVISISLLAVDIVSVLYLAVILRFGTQDYPSDYQDDGL